MRSRAWSHVVGAGALALICHPTQGATVDDAAAPEKPAHDAKVPAAGATARGNASYYAKRFAGRKTASGERYDPDALTAAHRTLPLGTKVKVVNPKNDRSVVVTVNDRGPVPKNRILDVSSAAADALDMKKSGVTKVETEVVGKPGDDSKAR